jgi:serine/threonine protein kinase
MELMEGGNLEEYLNKMPMKTEVNIQNMRSIIRQITRALAYLHE